MRGGSANSGVTVHLWALAVSFAVAQPHPAQRAARRRSAPLHWQPARAVGDRGVRSRPPARDAPTDTRAAVYEPCLGPLSGFSRQGAVPAGGWNCGSGRQHCRSRRAARQQRQSCRGVRRSGSSFCGSIVTWHAPGMRNTVRAVKAKQRCLGGVQRQRILRDELVGTIQ
jgi:hypothetical protein